MPFPDNQMHANDCIPMYTGTGQTSMHNAKKQLFEAFELQAVSTDCVCARSTAN